MSDPITYAARFKRRLGARLRELRDGKGWSVTHLADMAGTTQPWVSAVETGAKLPTSESLHRLCKALGCSMGKFDDIMDEKLE